jgi:hypothetical protein
LEDNVKMNLKVWGGIVWSGFIWLRIQTGKKNG